ncbi:hypothetical protein KMZ15_02615 [Mycoavidus sp. HKI]|uniref:hypothetical protein n=1 Tax=Mycoavidus sp. HKI TaxID=2840467 RepID=UPI0021583724|nr:hypothetical protein [Mycoavidus sp. HKI]UAW64589.2 hypothetical protein KMZ15_02615 [Mycoavidus sp. HKI]
MMVNQADFPVQALCRILNVSRSAYYGWHKRVPSAREQENAQLIEDIRTIHAESDETYGNVSICNKNQVKFSIHGN